MNLNDLKIGDVVQYTYINTEKESSDFIAIVKDITDEEENKFILDDIVFVSGKREDLATEIGVLEKDPHCFITEKLFHHETPEEKLRELKPELFL